MKHEHEDEEVLRIDVHLLMVMEHEDEFEYGDKVLIDYKVIKHLLL